MSVSGANLTDAIVITPPADFQISLTSGSGWVSNSDSISLTTTSGTVDSTTIYVRLNPTSATTYCANITHTSTGATQKDVAVSGSSVPTITASSAMTAFASAVGTPSAEQNYTVSGINLTDDIEITLPADFQISLTSGSGWVSNPNTISLTPSGGTVSDTTIYVRLNPTNATTYSANITHTGTGATQKDVAVTGSSVPTITATSSMTAFSSAAGVPSAEKSYTVSGINLTGDIAILAPTDFEISITSGGTFGSSLSLTPTGGVVGSTTIYVRFNRSTAGASSGDITHDSTGATQKRVAVSGTASDPTITTSGTLNAFSATSGVLSAEQTYTVSGSYLKGNITVTAPDDFEISTTSGSGFRSLLTLTPSGGTLASTTIYVRFNRATAGISSGSITHASTDATTQNVAVSGTATTCATVNLTAAEDTHMRSGSSRGNYNYGGRDTVRVNPYYVQGGTDDQLTGALFKWVLTDIPTNATVNAASLTFNVTDSSTYAYSLYNMRRAWTEGTAVPAVLIRALELPGITMAPEPVVGGRPAHRTQPLTLTAMPRTCGMRLQPTSVLPAVRHLI